MACENVEILVEENLQTVEVTVEENAQVVEVTVQEGVSVVGVQAYEAGEVIASGDPVSLMAGLLYKTDSNDTAKISSFLGISKQSGLIGERIEVDLGPVVARDFWAFTAERRIYINGKTLSETPPTTGHLLTVGSTTDIDTVILRPEEPEVLA